MGNWKTALANCQIVPSPSRCCRSRSRRQCEVGKEGSVRIRKIQSPRNANWEIAAIVLIDHSSSIHRSKERILYNNIHTLLSCHETDQILTSPDTPSCEHMLSYNELVLVARCLTTIRLNADTTTTNYHFVAPSPSVYQLLLQDYSVLLWIFVLVLLLPLSISIYSINRNDVIQQILSIGHVLQASLSAEGY